MGLILIPLKDKKCVTIINFFQKIINISKRKPNKIWLEKGSEFYNKPIKSWLEKNIYRSIFNTK